MKNARPVVLRRHALFKRHYRLAVAATPDFHSLEPSKRWALLREQVEADVAGDRATLLETLDSREPRRDQVLTALEEGRQAHMR